MQAVPTDAHAIPPAQDIQCGQYQLDIHMKLRDSGLAQRIAGGPDTLPWICDFIPSWQRRIIQPRRPSTPEQMAVHVMSHLEWYLEPPQPTRISVLRSLAACSFSLIVVVIALVVVIWCRPSPVVGLLSYAAIVLGVIAGMAILVGQSQTDRLRYDIRCAEFYHYLIDAYTDEGIV